MAFQPQDMAWIRIKLIKRISYTKCELYIPIVKYYKELYRSQSVGQIRMWIEMEGVSQSYIVDHSSYPVWEFS